MNNKEGNNKKSGTRISSRSNANKPTRAGGERSGAKPAMPKRAQGPKKAKPPTKAAETATDKVEKKPNQAPKRPKIADEIRLNKYIANSCKFFDIDSS